MDKIIKEVNDLYMRLELGAFFDTYHDYMYDMKSELNYMEDDEIEDAKEILKKCKALIEAQSILLANGL